jgi:hypothetical protein
MTRICASLLGGIARSLKPNVEWHMELVEESKKPSSEPAWWRNR